MIQNESEVDRLVRAVLGVILFLIGYSVGEGLWQIAFYVLGGLMIITSLTGFCLLYKIFGASTIKK